MLALSRKVLPDAQLRELDDAQAHGVGQRAAVDEHAAQLVHLAVLLPRTHAVPAHRTAVRICTQHNYIRRGLRIQGLWASIYRNYI